MFNFMFDIVNGNIHSPPKGLANDPNSLVIFPPDGKCEGGSMVDVHLTEVMSHATVKIIVSLEQQLELCEESRIKNTPPPNIPLSTHYDELDDSFYQIKDSSSSHLVSTSQLKRLFRKRSQGRLRKWMADLCLQVGSICSYYYLRSAVLLRFYI